MKAILFILVTVCSDGICSIETDKIEFETYLTMFNRKSAIDLCYQEKDKFSKIKEIFAVCIETKTDNI